MMMAKRQGGVITSVTPGYRGNKKTAQAKLSNVQWLVNNLQEGARELRELATSEIVYATMDTMRLVTYLRYELGIDRMQVKNSRRRALNNNVSLELAASNVKREMV